jgi:hypothetical protein
MVLNIFGSPVLTDNGGDVGGKKTDNPYIMLNNSDGTAKVVFVNGQNDWTISDSNNMTNIEWNVEDDNYDSCQISVNPDYDPDAEVTTEGVTEYVETDNQGDDTDNGPESDSADKSEKKKASSDSSEKPSKTVKDIENMTISDEDYKSGNIDLSEYMVDGEIPEDVLAALDKKFEEKAKEMGDDASADSANETDGESSEVDDSEQTKDENTTEDFYTIDPETSEITIDEEALKNRKSEELTVLRETILTVSSKQYNTTEYIRVSFMSDGSIRLSVSKKGPKK